MKNDDNVIAQCPNCGTIVTQKELNNLNEKQKKIYRRTGYLECKKCNKMIDTETCFDEILADFYKDDEI